jgi:signal recognition particle subunit SRP54
VKIVHDRQVELMGGQNANINSLTNSLRIMLVGLQGCGKTTTAAKLALLLMKERKKFVWCRRTFIVPPPSSSWPFWQTNPCGVYDSKNINDPVEICFQAVEDARKNGYDVLIIDTAGRLHIDDVLMEELQKIKARVNPAEIIYVADAMTGQDAVNVGAKFNELIGIDGVIMTKMDGDARGGSALSLISVIEKPIKFVALGNNIIWKSSSGTNVRDSGHGGILTLVEKAQATIDK